LAQTITVSVAAVNTFTSPVAVTITGLPNGVTASSSSFTLSPSGSPQQVTLSASSQATPGASTLTIQGVSGSLSHSAQVSITVEVAVTNTHAPIRSRYLRTNGYYHPAFAEQHMAAYDAVHKQFFVSNPYLNEIDVFDAVQEIQTATIPVQSPWGIDVSPYNGMLYAGTLIGDVYEIDTSKLSVIQRFPTTSIGPSGFSATAALVLSDGRLALQGAVFGNRAFGFTDGYGGAAVWNSVTNELDIGNSNGTAQLCPAYGLDLTLTGDRTKMVMRLSSIYTNPAVVCTYDPIAKLPTTGTVPMGNLMRLFAAPTGSIIYALNQLGVAAYDTSTNQVVAQNLGPIQYSLGQLSLLSGIASPDGKTVYVTSAEYASVGIPVVALDAQTLQLVGWVPSFQGSGAEGTTVADAIDSTGLIIGPIQQGVGFLDTALTQPSSYSSIQAGFASPGSGPADEQTTISGFATGSLSSGATMSKVYIGNAPASDLTFSSAAEAKTPISGVKGAVDVTTVFSDGALAITPEGFSYGPTVLEVLNNAAPSDGGETGYIIGYGFGGTTGKQGATQAIVTVGNQIATKVTSQSGQYAEPEPFNTDELMFTIPSGIAGTAEDLTITTPSGSVTMPGAIHYIHPVKKFPLSDTLQGGIYDSRRDLYYFTGVSKIEVLSVAKGGWQTPISLAGTSASSLFVGIAESPDGSKLAVSDETGQAIYILDPDNPIAVQRFAMPASSLPGFPSPGKPTGIAVTNDGKVYFVATDTTAAAVHCWNSTTGSLTDIGSWNSGASGNFYHVFLSPDGSRLYVNAMGLVYFVDLVSGQVTNSLTFHNTGPGLASITPDFSISKDGSTLEVSGFFSDQSLNAFMQPYYNEWETWYANTLNGLKLNGDGTIVFQALADGIDLLSRNTGRLLYRVQIPEGPSDNLDPMVLGNGNNVLAVITNSGVSIVDTSSLPIPSAVSQGFPAASQQTQP
jgi:hypothetical protein